MRNPVNRARDSFDNLSNRGLFVERRNNHHKELSSFVFTKFLGRSIPLQVSRSLIFWDLNGCGSF